jgi:hypothetical protein
MIIPPRLFAVMDITKKKQHLHPSEFGNFGRAAFGSGRRVKHRKISRHQNGGLGKDVRGSCAFLKPISTKSSLTN